MKPANRPRAWRDYRQSAVLVAPADLQTPQPSKLALLAVI
jgi:hypothetical protein